MPGILHQNAVRKALSLLGDGAQVDKFNVNIYRWFFWTGEELDLTEDGLDEQGLTVEEFHKKYENPEDVPLNPSKLFIKYPKTYENIKEAFGAQLVPDAYKIVRHVRDDGYGKMFQIQIIEVDGSSKLRKKIERYSIFGSKIESSVSALLRLKIFSEHFMLLGEYSEENLFMLSIEQRGVQGA